MARWIALLLLGSSMATAIVDAASDPKQTTPHAMDLRVKENICLEPLQGGADFKKFREVITAEQKQRMVAQSNAGQLKLIFSSIDLDANGILSSAEVLGAKGGDDKYCGAPCDSNTGRGCPAKCHCHRNEGRCAKDGR